MEELKNEPAAWGEEKMHVLYGSGARERCAENSGNVVDIFAILQKESSL